ncbi:MAG: hypothetical protein WBX13_03375 [Candidatus Acidiferrales bacterium]
MMHVFPAPAVLPDFLSQTSANVCSALVVSFTTLLYLAMTLIPFWRESGAKLPKPKEPGNTLDQGEEK